MTLDVPARCSQFKFTRTACLQHHLHREAPWREKQGSSSAVTRRAHSRNRSLAPLMDCRDEIATTAAASGSAATSPNTDTRAAASRDAASSSATAATIPAAASTVEACTSNITACTNPASTAVQLARDEALVAGTVSTADAESTAAPESTTANPAATPLPTSPPLDAVPPFDDDARARAKALAASYGKPRTQETGLRALHAVTHNATPDAALQFGISKQRWCEWRQIVAGVRTADRPNAAPFDEGLMLSEDWIAYNTPGLYDLQIGKPSDVNGTTAIRLVQARLDVDESGNLLETTIEYECSPLEQDSMVAAEARRKRNRRREEEALRSLDVTAQAEHRQLKRQRRWEMKCNPKPPCMTKDEYEAYLAEIRHENLVNYGAEYIGI